MPKPRDHRHWRALDWLRYDLDTRVTATGRLSPNPIHDLAELCARMQAVRISYFGRRGSHEHGRDARSEALEKFLEVLILRLPELFEAARLPKQAECCLDDVSRSDHRGLPG